jgi:Ca2+-binding RTX toxin-like protein
MSNTSQASGQRGWVRWLGRQFGTGARPRPIRRPDRTHLNLESLEQRDVPSTIAWRNRGTVGNDSDNFQAVYGANAPTARLIVREALDDWAETIQNFNFQNVGTDGNAPRANRYTLTISAVANLTGSDGRPLRGGTTNLQVDDAGVPYAATIQLDGDRTLGTGNTNWWYDATPNDNAQFGRLINRFEAKFAGAGIDLYRTILHETGHAMGLGSNDRLLLNTGGFLSPAGTDQLDVPTADDPAADLVLFTGTNVSATLTRSGGTHVYDGAPDPGFLDVPIFPNDLMNPGRNVPSLNVTDRRLISDLDAQILEDTYGYTITLPSQRETFLVVLNSTTGQLTINGDPQIVDDTIMLDRQGGNVIVAVDDVSAFVPNLAVTQITIAANIGNDDILIRRTDAAQPVTVAPGSQANTITVGSGTGSLDRILGTITVQDDVGDDTLILDDHGDRDAGIYTLQRTGVLRSGAAAINYEARLDALVVLTGSGDNRIDIEGTRANATSVRGGARRDTFNVGGNVGYIADFGDLVLDGAGGADTVNFIDIETDAAQIYQITETQLLRPSFTPISFASAEVVNLFGTAEDDTIDVLATAAGTAYTVNGWGGNDIINVDSVFDPGLLLPPRDTILGRLNVQGSFGRDTLNLLDQEKFGGTTYTVTPTRMNRTGLAAIDYGTIEALNLNAGSGDDTINVRGTAPGVDTALFGGFGNDAIRVGDLGNIVRNLDGALTVDGGSGSDDVAVNDQNDQAGAVHTLGAGSYQMAGQQAVHYGGVESFALNAARGDDTFSVLGTALGVATQVNAGRGNDNITIGNGARLLDDLDGSLLVRGAAGRDTLTFDDFGDPNPTHYTLTSTTFERTGTALVTYDTVDEVVINGGGNSDSINVMSTSVNTIIDAGSGDDTVNVGGYVDNVSYFGGSLDEIRGRVTVHGQESADDQLWIHDWADRSDNVYELESTRFTRGNARVDFDGTIELLRLASGIGLENVNVRSTAATTTTALSGKAGGLVTFNFGNAAGSLDDILGPVTIAGMHSELGSFDVLNLNDQGDLDPNSYAIGSTVVMRNDAPLLNYVFLAGITLNAGANDDVIDVTSSEEGSITTLNGGGGSDTLTGSNAVNYFLVTGADAGQLSAVGGPVLFSSFENLLGQGGYDIFAFAAGPGISGRIDGGGGARDTLDYSALTTGVTVNLQSGSTTNVAGGISGIENVIGGSGNDLVIGDAADNLLQGNGGRDILIGALGADELNGGDGEDLLLGGATLYDLDIDAWGSVTDEWARVDRGYDERIAQLQSGVGANNAIILDATTVFDDGSTNRLTGGLGLDWFFLNATDLSDWDPLSSEQRVPL